METTKPTAEQLKSCTNDLECIRNVCILAHVDHGKTTVADLLLATNRLVSKRMAGLLRYLDDRPDEQKRGITMKSSSVSLLNSVFDEEMQRHRKILLNLIDTPGHIDFSSEVGAALRVCDGAIILVDAVEGVCVQTRESIGKAYEEHAKMILVINKLDRLIIELGQDLDLMFQSINKIVEDCNVIIAELYQYDFNDETDIEDTGLLFAPDTGNVIFASAIDGWAFTTRQLSKMMIGLVKNETVETLNKKLWNFDYWLDSKGEIRSGAIDKHKPNIFTQLCLKTISHIYQILAVRMERDKVPAIIKKLNITNPTSEMTTANDPKAQVKAILSAWMPLAHTLLLQCLKIIPSPNSIQKSKIDYLLRAHHYIEDAYLSKCVEKATPHFERVSTSADSPTIAYVSKMFCVNKRNLSQNAYKEFKPRPRGEAVPPPPIENLTINGEEKTVPEESIPKPGDDISVIALARVFTGRLKVGQKIYALLNGYLPNESQISNNPEAFIEAKNPYVSRAEIKQLYMLFGKELLQVDSVPAGNFCGIGGIEQSVLRTATLSSDLEMVPLVEHPTSQPVVRYAIEPSDPKQLPILRESLKLLMQSDSCVQVIMQESGELVILTAGDVHLDKCIEDLKTKFAKIDVQVSSPMVSLRETVIDTPLEEATVDLNTNYIDLSVSVVALPSEIASVIRNNHQLLRTVEEHQHHSLIDLMKHFDGAPKTELQPKVFKSEFTNRALVHLREQLNAAFESCGGPWSGLGKNIWSVGKIEDCPNLLINETDDYVQDIFLQMNVTDKRTLLAQCVVNSFHTMTKAGPICEEPLMNCAFLVKKYNLVKDFRPEDITPYIVSSEEAAARGLLKIGFEKKEQRLMEPMYTTAIQVNTNILGKVYTVVSKRHGKVLEAVGMDEKEKMFLVQAQIPVIESVGFASEIRKTTSGQANPSLRFSHYEIIEGDPYFVPVEDEDDSDDEYEAKLESGLRANKLRREVRRRKGLAVEDEVVVHAEKQRTLNKKK